MEQDQKKESRHRQENHHNKIRENPDIEELGYTEPELLVNNFSSACKGTELICAFSIVRYMASVHKYLFD